jgi:hypothetical protein
VSVVVLVLHPKDKIGVSRASGCDARTIIEILIHRQETSAECISLVGNEISLTWQYFPRAASRLPSDYP